MEMVAKLCESARWKGMHLENIDGVPLDDRSLPAVRLPACLPAYLPQLGTKYRWTQDARRERLQTKLARERTEDVVVAHSDLIARRSTVSNFIVMRYMRYIYHFPRYFHFHFHFPFPRAEPLRVAYYRALRFVPRTEIIIHYIYIYIYIYMCISLANAIDADPDSSPRHLDHPSDLSQFFRRPPVSLAMARYTTPLPLPTVAPTTNSTNNTATPPRQDNEDGTCTKLCVSLVLRISRVKNA